MSCGDSDEEYDPSFVSVPADAPNGGTDVAASPAVEPQVKEVSSQPTSSVPLAKQQKAASSAVPTISEGGFRLHCGVKGRIRCLCVNPSGTILCAGSEDGQLCMWDFNTPLVSRRLLPTRVLTPFVNRIAGLQPIIALSTARDGSFFVACQDGDSPALVSATGKQLGYCAMGERGIMDVVQCKGHRAPVTCVAAHAVVAGRFFTGGQDGTVRLWDQASYERCCVYAVKHGSGQLRDTHVVESTASLHALGGGGQVFASGAQDGTIQLWDCRVKYRPGGALSTIDMYGGAHAKAADGFSDEKHVGGMVEVQSSVAGSSVFGLAVRLNSRVVVVDLRNAKSAPPPDVTTLSDALPFVLDTTSVCLGPKGSGSFLTGTSRAGYEHVVGGHVVQFTWNPTSSPSVTAGPPRVWASGRLDEDVLCACADTSSPDGCIFAGLSSGDVSVHGAFDLSSVEKPFAKWVNSRPARDVDHQGIGEKRPRGGVGHDDLVPDLF